MNGKALGGKSLLLVGFTLFSMFFGAGNLIFPPFLGAQAGTNAWIAFFGFALSAIGFPVLGVIAVARSGGLRALASRVHPAFAAVFTMLIYLSIGPCLAIPRTAGTSFEMAVTPFLGAGAPVGLLQLLYSVLFFAVALCLALRPEKLTDRLGKILCPCLIVLIVVVFAGCLMHPVGGYGVPTARYAAASAAQGFLDGYQTMDTIAALNFGIVIALNIRAKGVEEDRAVVRGTVRAGWIAGAVLLVIYAMLTHVGARAGTLAPDAANGAESLTAIVSVLYGKWGSVILAAIFVIACLNTCVGLISCCSEYFHGLIPKLSYRAWALFFAFISMVIANAGLNQILAISIPVLSAIYPVAIVLILLSFFQRWLSGLHLVYPLSVLFTGIASVLYVLAGLGLRIPGISTVLWKIPLAGLGFGWVLPAALGAGIGVLLSLGTRRPRGLTQRLFRRALDFRLRIFNMLALVGITISVLTTVIASYTGAGPMTAILSAVAGTLAMVLLYYTNRSRRYKLCFLITVVAVFVLLFPLMFFAGGGYKSGMPVYFVFAVTLTAVMLDGRKRFVFVGLELFIYAGCLLTAFLYPERVIPLATAEAVFWDVFAGILAVGVLLALTMFMIIQMYDNQQRELDEQNVVLARTNRAKTEFLTNASHEMRTPLTVVSVNVQTVMGILRHMDERVNDTEAAELLADAQAEIMCLANMVDGMLSMSAICENTEKSKTDLSTLLRGSGDALRLMLAKRGNVLRAEIEEGLTVYCAADPIQQVLSNLIQNAHNHTENGTIRLRAVRNGAAITVTVGDDGTGVSPELLPHVFERGVSDDGTGFGLFLCKTVVESHGGSIQIDSENGRGTEVVFTLPVYAGQFEGDTI